MSFDNGEYLVVYFGCDITGEKAYKEFYVAGKNNMDRFSALGVIEEVNKRLMLEIVTFLNADGMRIMFQPGSLVAA